MCCPNSEVEVTQLQSLHTDSEMVTIALPLITDFARLWNAIAADGVVIDLAKALIGALAAIGAWVTLIALQNIAIWYIPGSLAAKSKEQRHQRCHGATIEHHSP